MFDTSYRPITFKCPRMCVWCVTDTIQKFSSSIPTLWKSYTRCHQRSPPTGSVHAVSSIPSQRKADLSVKVLLLENVLGNIFLSLLLFSPLLKKLQELRWSGTSANINVDKSTLYR